MNNSEKFHIKYKVEIGDFSVCRDELEAIEDEVGYCDAIIIHSINLPPDGSKSEFIYGFDGKKKEIISDNHMFSSLFCIAHKLSKSNYIDKKRQDLCARVCDEIKKLINEECKK